MQNSETKPGDDERELNDPTLGLLARGILDGTPVDWNVLETDAGGLDEAMLRQFRVLADVVALHNSLPAPEPGIVSRSPAAVLPEDLGQWGPLMIRERVGEGAFGEVFRAWDTRLDREVALKFLRPFSGQTSESATASIEEGRLLARVRHPNVITVYGAERIDGRIGIWTEFIHGRTLARLVREHGRLGPREATAIGLDLCRALSAVHHAGLLHRDIKPENVIREEGGRIVLLDFGAGRNELKETITRANELTGTPLYLAPELWQGHEATPQSDIYSVGVLLYYLLTGGYPVHGKTVAEVRKRQASGRHILLRDARPDLPDVLVDVVECAIAADRRDRYQSAGALEAALKAAQGSLEHVAATEHPPGQRVVTRHRLAIRWTWIATAAGIIAAVAVALLLDIGHIRSRIPHRLGGVDQRSPVVTVRLPQFEMGRPSRDGRYLPYVDMNGDLQVWERSTGRSQRAVEKGSSGESVLMSAMSPNGDRVAYAVSTALGGSELRVVNADGTGPSVLVATARVLVFTPVPMAWSRDGREILCKFQQRDGSTDLALVPSAGGASRLLWTFRGAAPGNVSLSPDGRYVIYYLRPDPKVPTRDLFILGTDGSAPRILLKADASDVLPMWTPDARGVFFMRNSPTFDESKDGWILRVVNGFAAGDPIRVLSNLGPASGQAALTDLGALLYMLPTDFNDVYTSSLDLTGATAPGPPTRISATVVGHHLAPAFSPNGRTLAYLTTRESPAPLNTLTIQDRRTGDAHSVPARLSFLNGSTPAWMPDSVHVVVWGKDLAGRAGYFKVDTHTGETSAILLTDIKGAPSFVCSPDGRTFLYVDQRGVVARDLASGAERVAVAIGGWSGIQHLSLSPSGQSLAFVATTGGDGNWSKSLEVQTLNGPMRELVRVRFPEWLVPHAWTPDGHDLLFGRLLGGAKRPMTLWRVAASGGEPHDLHLPIGTGPANAATLAPDGRQIAYGEGAAYWQLLAVEHFLPPTY